MPKIICACGRTVDTKPEWGGQWMSCPGCQGTLYAPFPGDKPAPPIPVIDIVELPPPALPPPMSPPLPVQIGIGSPTRLCPWCAETIALSALSCPFCKGDPSTAPAAARAATSTTSTIDPGGLGPLIWGIIGFMFCQLVAPVAWAMGSSYEKSCRAKGLKPSSAGTAGKVLGIVGTVFLFLMLAFMVIGMFAQG